MGLGNAIQLLNILLQVRSSKTSQKKKMHTEVKKKLYLSKRSEPRFNSFKTAVRSINEYFMYNYAYYTHHLYTL